MLETEEEYKHIIDTMPVQAIGKAMYLTDLIESLRAVARAVDTFSSDDNMLTWDFDGHNVPDSYYVMCKALDALPAWCLEE